VCYIDEFYNTWQRQGIIPTPDQIEGPNIALTTPATTTEDYGIMILNLTEHHKHTLLLHFYVM
jgi:hypothetical protein